MALTFLPDPGINPLTARNVALDVRVILGKLYDIATSDAVAKDPAEAARCLTSIRNWAERGLAELEAHAHG